MDQRYYRLIRAVITIPLLLSMASYSYAMGWEYLVKTYPLMGNDAQLGSTLTALGQKNWELVNCTVEDASLTCFFKRPAK